VGIRAAAPLLLCALVAHPEWVRAASPADGEEGARSDERRVEASAEASQPLPETAPPNEPAAESRFSNLAARSGWFAYRDPRTGELVVPPPQVLLEREGAEREASRARAARALLVERRLPNGAVEIELPDELLTTIYAWIDEHGELRTGDRPPSGPATPSRSERPAKGGRR
jgi:hypothetical protein